MRRPLVFTFLIGLIVAAVVSVAHARGWLLPAERPMAAWAQRGDPARVLADSWQFIFVTLLSIGVAWLTFSTGPRYRVAWLVLGLAAELVALLWVGSLYHVLFQPLPCILAAVLSYAAAISCLAWIGRPRKPAREPRPAKLREPKRPPAEVTASASAEAGFDGAARAFETTVLVCDLADKYELADSAEPPEVASVSANFGARAAEILLKAGAHLYRNDGEGVVAIFGFPRTAEEHAEKAVRAAFELSRTFARGSNGSNGENAWITGAHVGVSSGSIIAARTEAKRDVFILGEPVELARRFCVANRFYGSRTLIGPRTFELASRTVVARPIDFLSGVTVQERHEIYEPLALAADAPADLLARRDSFWNGVVLYREKRWAEAYMAFQQARGAPDEEDAPLNLYLRRLEPLALQLMESARE